MREWAFLMIDYDTPEFIKDLHNRIKESELYTEEGNDDYGIEEESHVTLVPCLDNDIDLDELKKLLDPIEKYDIILTNVSMFENEKYDVLKCDAQSFMLGKSNEKILQKFESHSEYKEYHPHMTVAYLKKGMGEKYTKDILDRLVVMKPKCFRFSYVGSDGEDKYVRFKT